MWIVACTKPGAADLATINVARQGFNYYLPKLKIVRLRRGKRIELERSLFPGYMFVEVIDRWYSLMNTLGISRILTNNGKPEAVNPQLVESLRACEVGGYYQFPDPPEPFERGQPLRVTTGLMASQFCVYECMTVEDRVRVLFRGLGFDFSTEMPTRDLETV